MFTASNWRPVEATFDLKWTGRYRFDFADARLALDVSTIVIPMGFDRVDDVEKAMSNAGITSGFSLGSTFRGRYRNPAGGTYDDRSLTIQITSMAKHDLVKLATVLARDLGQESVLARVAATGEVFLVTDR